LVHQDPHRSLPRYSALLQGALLPLQGAVDRPDEACADPTLRVDARPLAAAPGIGDYPRGDGHVDFAVEEDLWFGDTSDDAAEAGAAASFPLVPGGAARLLASPEPAQRLLELTHRPDSSVDEAVKTLVSDAALSARVLRLANSPAFALKANAASIAHA